MEPYTSDASPSIPEVFIATAAPINKGQKHRRDARSIHAMVTSATDAAIAMNSIKFMELLSNNKAADDIKTYTQTPTIDGLRVGDHAPTSSIEQHNQSTPDDGGGSSWSLSSWIFASGNAEKASDSSSGHLSNSNHDCLFHKTTNKQHTPKTCTTSHETVSEYNGRLWFLPADKGTIRFRETIRVISISADGQSSSIECISQYFNGTVWVDCSKVVCNFSSVPIGNAENENSGEPQEYIKGEQVKVRMVLESELLVWLPLPKLASNAVSKKISSVFESVALNFFGELASL